jgi:hypothetical protein
MSETLFRQAPRTEADGPIELRRSPIEGRYVLVVNDKGHERSVTFSEHTAAQIFVVLGMALGIPLSNKLLKKIKL